MQIHPATKKFKLTNDEVCQTCAKPLVKQHLDKVHCPLAPEYLRLFELVQEHNTRGKQCTGCGCFCYHSTRDKTPLSDCCDGLCKQCGGTNTRHRPKSLLFGYLGGQIILGDLRQQRLRRTWSCSDCGYGFITPEIKASRQALHARIAARTLDPNKSIRTRVTEWIDWMQRDSD